MEKSLKSSIFCFIFLFLFLSPLAWTENPRIKKFDHGFHVQKVFQPNNIDCSTCHNMERQSGSTFRKPMKQMCHECHQSAEPKYKAAPKACFTCHDSMDSLSAIKPETHASAVWKQTHSIQARADGDACLNCHTNSQCVKCHSQRDTLFQSNHPRSYRNFHSIEARMAPQKCDTCHTKSYCTQCHMGKN